ncbi:MAG TPA: heme exporter protein CcmB [Gammaproteobacteria bacterium]|jgi:heme exporter protein B|nr:heme exporter protein CcmB [Gammaproteobacteria bacterium]
MIKTIYFVFYTELILLLQRSQAWLYPLGFFAIVLVLFPLALTPDPVMLKKIMPGCLWIVTLLAQLLSVESTFTHELEDGSIEQLILSQIPFSLCIFAKLCAQWVASALPLILLTPLVGLSFQLDIHTIGILSLSLLIGTPLLTMLGSLIVALSIGLEKQGMLLGLLILPLTTPVLIFGVSIVQQAQAGISILGALCFLAGLSVLSITLLPWVIASSLKLSCDS